MGVDIYMLVALPLLMIWGVWIVRNNLLFNDKACTPSITGSIVCGFLNSLPRYTISTRHREALEVELDKSVPWGFL